MQYGELQCDTDMYKVRCMVHCTMCVCTQTPATSTPAPPGPGQLKTNTLGLRGKFEKPSDMKTSADKKSTTAAPAAASTDSKAKEGDKTSADAVMVNGEQTKFVEQTQLLLKEVQKKRDDDAKELQVKTTEWEKEREVLQGKVSLVSLVWKATFHCSIVHIRIC
jgi:hypothetical protein